MNKNVIIAVLVIPALIALAHDGIYYYFHQDEGFFLSDLGWLWLHYHKESHDAFIASLERETAEKLVAPILQLYAVLVAFIFSCIVVGLGILFQAMGNVGKGRYTKRSKSSLGRTRGENKKMKYNRR